MNDKKWGFVLCCIGGFIVGLNSPTFFSLVGIIFVATGAFLTANNQ